MFYEESWLSFINLSLITTFKCQSLQNQEPALPLHHFNLKETLPSFKFASHVYKLYVSQHDAAAAVTFKT